jgi:hypothetical protein
MMKRASPILTFLLLWPVLCFAQDDETTKQSDPRKFSITGGIGNATGWFGLQAEYYFHGDRFSVFGGAGYTPSFDAGDPSGFTVAAGGRVFTSGVKHRAYLEGSVSPIAISSPIESTDA